MAVRRFKSVEEMEEHLWRPPGDPALLAAIAAVWDFAERTVPRRFPPGVYRHGSIEAAQRLRDAWEEADFQRLWRARGGLPAAPKRGEEQR